VGRMALPQGEGGSWPCWQESALGAADIGAAFGNPADHRQRQGRLRAPQRAPSSNRTQVLPGSSQSNQAASWSAADHQDAPHRAAAQRNGGRDQGKQEATGYRPPSDRRPPPWFAPRAPGCGGPAERSSGGGGRGRISIEILRLPGRMGQSRPPASVPGCSECSPAAQRPAGPATLPYTAMRDPASLVSTDGLSWVIVRLRLGTGTATSQPGGGPQFFSQRSIDERHLRDHSGPQSTQAGWPRPFGAALRTGFGARFFTARFGSRGCTELVENRP